LQKKRDNLISENYAIAKMPHFPVYAVKAAFSFEKMVRAFHFFQFVPWLTRGLSPFGEFCSD
jgi:hypothetical protein